MMFYKVINVSLGSEHARLGNELNYFAGGHIMFRNKNCLLDV
jgi:hypothetical protein